LGTLLHLAPKRYVMRKEEALEPFLSAGKEISGYKLISSFWNIKGPIRRK
jgi:hypothetical protein